MIRLVVSAISIHALREEGDLVPPPVVNDPAEFLSTPSARRATKGAGNVCLHQGVFLSTPSARRATVDGGVQVVLESISIHALREEGD